MSNKVPIAPGDVQERFIPDAFETWEKKPTFLLGAIDYRCRLAMKKHQKEYQRIQWRIALSMGVTHGQIQKDLDTENHTATKEEVSEEFDRRMKSFDAENPTQDMIDLGSDLEEITIDPDFIEATLGKHGKPIALLGWENLYWQDGTELIFDAMTYLDDLARWDAAIMIIVAQRVYEISTISGASAKN